MLVCCKIKMHDHKIRKSTFYLKKTPHTLVYNLIITTAYLEIYICNWRVVIDPLSRDFLIGHYFFSQDYLMALSLQQEQQSQDLAWEQIPEGISDLELAKKLQEEEDRRASQYYHEQEQAAAAQSQVMTFCR